MNKFLQKKLKNLNIVIATHVFADGPALFLEEYLRSRVNSLMFIGHPFAGKKDATSFYRYYLNEKTLEHKAKVWKLLPMLIHFKDALYTFWWIIKLRKKFDIYIGSDNFTAYMGLILKNLGYVEDVILYTIDFVPKRFESPILNFAYHYFDRQCLKRCKIVWNVSEKIAEGREKFSNLKRENCVSQIVVPLGVWYDRIPRQSFEKRSKNTIVFMGHILEKQGLDVVVGAMPMIISKIHDAKLKIIGTGPYMDNLKKLVRKLKIEKCVKFLGYIESHKKVEVILSESTIAVATYKPDPNSFTYFADPGKIKNYLGAGLPVILTNVPPIAKEVMLKKCALICKYDQEDVSEKIVSLLRDLKKLKVFGENAARYAKQFDWNIIFTNALERSL